MTALKNFGYLKETPTLIDLHVEMIKYGTFSVIMVIAFAPFMFMDPTIKPEDFITGPNCSELKKNILQTDECEKFMKMKLKEFDYKGWF